MHTEVLGGAVGAIVLLWYVFWRIGLVREIMRRAWLPHRHRKS